MGAPLFLAENFFNTIQFPNNEISTASNAAGQEVFRIGTARRSTLNRFRSAIPANTLDAVVTFEPDRVRSADTLIVDRNADIVGRTIRLRVITDIGDPGLTILEDVIDNVVVYGSSLNDPTHPITTTEAAYIWKFPEVAGVAMVVEVEPLAGDSGALGGVWLGKSFTPDLPRMPFDDEATWSDFDVVRRGIPNNDIRTGRTGAFSMMMSGESEWNEARRQFRDLFGKGHPMWIVPDSDVAERAWLGYNAPGSQGAAFSERPQSRSVVIQADEYDAILP